MSKRNPVNNIVVLLNFIGFYAGKNTFNRLVLMTIMYTLKAAMFKKT